MLLAACSSAPKPEATPQPEPAPAPSAAPPVAAVAGVPGGALGTWQLRVEIQSGNRPRPRGARDPQATATLTSAAAATRIGDGPATQYAATIFIPGYTRPARRGRNQAAAWWPVAGDSIVVQFTQGNQSRGEMQLRGALRGRELRGDIWYLSSATGSSFQLGTFTATKR